MGIQIPESKVFEIMGRLAFDNAIKAEVIKDLEIKMEELKKKNEKTN